MINAFKAASKRNTRSLLPSPPTIVCKLPAANTGPNLLTFIDGRLSDRGDIVVVVVAAAAGSTDVVAVADAIASSGSALMEPVVLSCAVPAAAARDSSNIFLRVGLGDEVGLHVITLR
jgi:hypothetical protein